MPRFKQRHLAAFTITVLLLGMGCANTPPPRALERGPTAVREMQTRVYDTGDEAFVLSAAVGVLQDLGFNLDESESALGVLAASKELSIAPPSMGSKIRSGAAGGGAGIFDEIVGEFLSNAWGITVSSGGEEDEHEDNVETYDVKEQIRVSLVTRPHGNEASSRVTVRLVFGRVVWNNLGQETMTESLTSAHLYQEFFANLAQAVFLEAHQI